MYWGVPEPKKSAFYYLFVHMQNVAATGKRFLLALDITTSMQHGHVTGSRHLSPVQAAAMMITVTLRREEHCDVISFSSDVQPIDLKSKKSLKDVVKGLEEVLLIVFKSFLGLVMVSKH